MYPPPITTTSPPPPDISIRYPDIMSQHQKSQGYVPSLHSMFNPVMKPPSVPSSLLFESDSKERENVSRPYLSGHNPSALYHPSLLPQPSVPVSQGHPQSYGPSAYAMQQQQQQARYAYSQQPQSVRYPDHPEASRPPVPSHSALPHSAPPHSAPPHSATPHPSQLQTVASSRIVRAPSTSRSADPVKNELKTVNLPRECLQRFLSIAALNTSQNMETCGLLLGKDKETKYVVTTLLIPKQHATSDTCTMDEEELVLQFTEERSLITLGWVCVLRWLLIFLSHLGLGSCRYTPIHRNHVRLP
jgi:STAM-binding protein